MRIEKQSKRERKKKTEEEATKEEQEGEEEEIDNYDDTSFKLCTCDPEVFVDARKGTKTRLVSVISKCAWRSRRPCRGHKAYQTLNLLKM